MAVVKANAAAIRGVGLLLVAAALAAGTAADRPLAHEPIQLGGYRVLAVDFHTHSSMWSDGALTPWGLVLEAERQGLDAIAVTAHNEVFDAHVARWFSELVDGPIVLVGEEVSAPGYHLIAAGISRRVSFRQPAAGAIEAIHAQGGVAIAAHPMPEFWAGYPDAAVRALDGSEICHPLVYSGTKGQRELERFAARGRLAAIGSSDFHALGAPGSCRTYVFAAAATPAAILDAIRAHRTVVYGRDNRAYGDPALVRLAADDGRLPREAPSRRTHGTTLDWISRIAAISGAAILLIVGL